jgi:hypothetical protein
LLHVHHNTPVIGKKQPDKYWYSVEVGKVSELWFWRHYRAFLIAEFIEYIYKTTLHFQVYFHPCEVPAVTALSILIYIQNNSKMEVLLNLILKCFLKTCKPFKFLCGIILITT